MHALRKRATKREQYPKRELGNESHIKRFTKMIDLLFLAAANDATTSADRTYMGP